MTQKEKAQFRKTKEWIAFRKRIAEKYNNKDAITGKKLYKGWTLHHLDLNPDNYKILNENNFIPLNKKTHDVIHFLFRYDLNILDKFDYYLKIMRALKQKELSELFILNK